MKNCAHCTQPNREGARFCMECGASLIEEVGASTKQLCQVCGEANQLAVAVCVVCGAPFIGADESGSRQAKGPLKRLCLECRREVQEGEDVCACGVYLPTLFRDLLATGTRLKGGSYEVRRVEGRGAFGVTYQAVRTDSGERVAIKEFFPKDMATRDPRNSALIVAADKRSDYTARLECFRTEGRMLRKVQHPGVVRALDVFEARGTVYLVMDFIEGRTLKDVLSQMGESVQEGLLRQWTRQLVESLEAIHAIDIHHLDLKPENILVTSEGRLVLVDFGSARVGGRIGTHSHVSFTIEYAAPEVVARHQVGPRSDLFSLGVMVCEMLTGRRPPDAIQRQFGVAWDYDTIPASWRQALEAALALEPAERAHNVGEWWREVQFVLRRPHVSEGWALIPAGRFMMGAAGWVDPVHEVEITRPFLMMKTPVTQGQWKALMGNNPSHFEGDDRPVECVNWFDAVAYCNALSEREGLEACYKLRGVSGKPGRRDFKCEDVDFKGLECGGYRLATEAEWEYACRAGTTGSRYGELDEIAWYGNPGGETHPVGQKKANGWGLGDMLGDVWEWCWDWYSSGYYGVSPMQDPTGPNSGEHRVARSVSFGSSASLVHAAYRSRNAPSVAHGTLGLRCVRSFHCSPDL